MPREGVHYEAASGGREAGEPSARGGDAASPSTSRICEGNSIPWLTLGDSDATKFFRRRIAAVAKHPYPVLIFGESGSGKELGARDLHARSGRKGNFVPVNCGAIPADLLESELFGHVEGAFTGATARHRGAFGRAENGTLFLDEIGAAPPRVQVTLLRAIEEQLILPVGADKPFRANVRIVAATNVDLEKMVAAERFREDLLARLEILRLDIAPLRLRPDDIPAIAASILAPLGARVELSALPILKAQPFPTNVRGLMKVLIRAIVHHGVADAESVTAELELDARRGVEPCPLPSCTTLEDDLNVVRRCRIIEALALENGNLTRAAKRLGLTRQGLQKMMLRPEIGLEKTLPKTTV